MQNKQRIEWIDALRAIAMIFVIYGHLVQGFTEYFVFTSPIKLPLFFAITGYLFSTKKDDSKAYFKNLLLKLVVPWLALSLIPPLLMMPLKGVKYFLTYFLDLIAGEHVWYMPALIIASIIHFFVRKYFKNTFVVILVSVIISSGGMILAHYHRLDYAMINTAMTAQFFLALGFLIRNTSDSWGKLKWTHLLGLMTAYLGLCVFNLIAFPEKNIDVHLNSYFNIPLCAILIVVGVWSSFILFQKANISSKLLVFIGQNTLVYYIYHMYIIQVCKSVISKFLKTNDDAWCTPAVSTLICIVAIVGCGVLSMLFNSFLPECVGKKRKSGNHETA